MRTLPLKHLTHKRCRRKPSVTTLLLVWAFYLQLFPLQRSMGKSNLAFSCQRHNHTTQVADDDGAIDFDHLDQTQFKQQLRGECRYYDDSYGLFAAETPHPRYIITGGAGFIGSHLVKALLRETGSASQIKVLDNLYMTNILLKKNVRKAPI